MATSGWSVGARKVVEGVVASLLAVNCFLHFQCYLSAVNFLLICIVFFQSMRVKGARGGGEEK